MTTAPRLIDSPTEASGTDSERRRVVRVGFNAIHEAVASVSTSLAGPGDPFRPIPRVRSRRFEPRRRVVMNVRWSAGSGPRNVGFHSGVGTKG